MDIDDELHTREPLPPLRPLTSQAPIYLRRKYGIEMKINFGLEDPQKTVDLYLKSSTFRKSST